LYPYPSPLIPICEAETVLQEGNSKITSHLFSSIAFVFSFVRLVQPKYLHISRIASCYFVVKLSAMAAKNRHTHTHTHACFGKRYRLLLWILFKSNWAVTVIFALTVI